MSKEPVFISFAPAEAGSYDKLSGKYIFHSIKNKAVAYERDGRVFSKNSKVSLIYQKSSWYFATDLETSDEKIHYWLKLQTQGLFYLIAYWTYYNIN